MGEVTARIAGIRFTVSGVAGDVVDHGSMFENPPVHDRVRALIAVELVRHAVMAPAAVAFLRRVARMKAADFAALLDVRAATVSNWETGKHPIPRGTWIALAWIVAERTAAILGGPGVTCDEVLAAVRANLVPPTSIDISFETATVGDEGGVVSPTVVQKSLAT